MNPKDQATLKDALASYRSQVLRLNRAIVEWNQMGTTYGNFKADEAEERKLDLEQRIYEINLKMGR